VETVVGRYQEFIAKNGGEVTNADRWGRRRLAYPIKKKNAGFYVQLLHKSPTDIVPKLEQAFRLDEDVIRHLTVVVDKNMLKARAGIKKRRRQRVSRIEQADIATAMAEKDHGEK
jgi:small subunit ribosomal protein S6